MNSARFARPATVLALAAALGLAACGKGASNKAAQKVPVDRFVFISAKDCADNGRLPMQKCAEIIDAAIASHINTTQSFPSLRSCETAEGGDRCERTDTKSFKPRLVAFLVSIAGDQAAAEPLYPPPGTEQGLRGVNKKNLVLVADETVTFSPRAIAAYEQNKGDASAVAATGSKNGF